MLEKAFVVLVVGGGYVVFIDQEVGTIETSPHVFDALLFERWEHASVCRKMAEHILGGTTAVVVLPFPVDLCVEDL